MHHSTLAKAFLTTALTSLVAPVAMAQEAENPLDDADIVEPFDEEHYATHDALVSGDGSVVWALSSRRGFTSYIVTWTKEDGTQYVGGPTGIWYSGRVYDVNRDGSVAVASLRAEGHNGAWRYTEEGGWSELEMLSGYANAYAYGVNADGTVVVGRTDRASPGQSPLLSPAIATQSAFRWVEGQGMEDIGNLGGSFAYAYGVNDAGNVVVGDSGLSSGVTRAFRWVEDEGMQDLGTLDGGAYSWARAVNADGSVVVGQSQVEVPDPSATPLEGSGAVTQNHAFRWVEGEGMTDLGTVGGRYGGSSAEDVNSDGSVVVGIVDTKAGSRAFHWHEEEGLTELGVLEGGSWSYAFSVSDDGNVVTGYGDSIDGNRAFVWGGGPVLDLQNTATQIGTNAQEQANAMNDLGHSVEGILGNELFPGAGGQSGGRISTQGGAARAPYALRFSLGASGGDGTGATVGGVSAALALSDSNMVLGGYLGLANEDGDLAGLDVDGTLLAGGLWLRGNPQGAGLTWKIGASHIGGDVNILRDASLSSTEAGLGSSRLSATSLQAEIGYGMDRGAMRLTPFAALRHTEVSRDGYTESNGVTFPLTYDDYDQSWTVARLGVHADMAAGPRGQLRLSGGLDVDLDRGSNPVTGTSAIPGMATFSVAGAQVTHETRGFANAQYVHGLGNGMAFDVSLGVTQSAYGGGAVVSGGLGLQMHF